MGKEGCGTPPPPHYTLANDVLAVDVGRRKGRFTMAEGIAWLRLKKFSDKALKLLFDQDKAKVINMCLCYRLYLSCYMRSEGAWQ